MIVIQYCEAKFSLCIKCAPTTLHDRFTKPAIIDDQKNGTSTSPDDDRLEVEFRKRMNQFSDANAQVIGYLDSVGRVVTVSKKDIYIYKKRRKNQNGFKFKRVSGTLTSRGLVSTRSTANFPWRNAMRLLGQL